MADATDKLADGLRRLRELARQLEQRPVTALMAAADEPRFLLVLDHDKPRDRATPAPARCRRSAHRRTAPPSALAAKPLSEVVQPRDLDPLTSGRRRRRPFDRLRGKRSLPDDVKTALA
jgi:hypothetical protein